VPMRATPANEYEASGPVMAPQTSAAAISGPYYGDPADMGMCMPIPPVADALQLVVQPPPLPHYNILGDGNLECRVCIVGSGKAEGHQGRHKMYAKASDAKKKWKRKNAVKQEQVLSSQLIVTPSSNVVCAPAAASASPNSRREASALQEAIRLLPGRFKDRSAATDAMCRFAASTGMNLHQDKNQNSVRVTFRCANCKIVRCGFKVTVYRPMHLSKYQAHWVLHHERSIWVHALACYQAPKPRVLEVAQRLDVRAYLASFKTLGNVKLQMETVMHQFESQGIQMPKQSGDQKKQSADDQKRRFCLRVCEKVLGYDDEGLSQSLSKLAPWCQEFEAAGNGDAHLEISQNGEFQAVVITWNTSASIVLQCGFRVVALDAATFDYMRRDLRLTVIVGYTSDNTLMPLAMMIGFNEDVHTYTFFFRTLKSFRDGQSSLWRFLDDEQTSVIADQGPLRCTRKAFKAVFERAELRSCSKHILDNCKKRAQALDGPEQGLLHDLAICNSELGVNALLDEIKMRSSTLYEYILKDDHYTHWVRKYLRNTFDAGKGTSNGAEQFFSVAKRKGMRQLRPLECLMEITRYSGESQQEFFNVARRRLRESRCTAQGPVLNAVPMTEYLEEEYKREKDKATALRIVGVPHPVWYDVDHSVSCRDNDPSQGYSMRQLRPHAGSIVPLTVTVRFERQHDGSVIVNCNSARCNTWNAKGYVCRHGIAVGHHDFPETGRLIERDGGTWWLRRMIRKEYRCQTICDVHATNTAFKPPPVPEATGSPIRMPVERSEHRADRKAGRYRAAFEPSSKGRAPPKRKERDSIAEAAQDLVLQLDESDCCLAIVYNQTTWATFTDGSATTGRARPVRVICAGPTLDPQPRLIATVHCFLSNEEKQFLIEHISFAAPITDYVARNDACTGSWWHPEEPARCRRVTQPGSATGSATTNVGQSLTLDPTAAQSVIAETDIGKFLMVVYVRQDPPRKSTASRPRTVYADGTPTDSVRPRPIQLLGSWQNDEMISVMCCLSKRRKKFSVQGFHWAQVVDPSVATGDGCSGSWTPHVSGPAASTRLSVKRRKAPNSNAAAAAAVGTAPSAASRQISGTSVTTHGNASAAASNLPKKVGVTKVGKKWRARVEHQGQRYNLGFYTSWDEAAAAVDKKREELQQQARGS
jgi:hypothetical protein